MSHVHPRPFERGSHFAAHLGKHFPSSSVFLGEMKAAPARRAGFVTKATCWAGQPVVRQERSLWWTQVLGCPLACLSVSIALPAGHLYNCNFTQAKTKTCYTGGRVKRDYTGVCLCVCFLCEEFSKWCRVPSSEGYRLMGKIIPLHLKRVSYSGGETDKLNTCMWHLTLRENGARIFKRWPLTLSGSWDVTSGNVGWTETEWMRICNCQHALIFFMLALLSTVLSSSLKDNKRKTEALNKQRKDNK